MEKATSFLIVLIQMSLVAICSLQDAQNAINDMTGKVGLSASVISVFMFVRFALVDIETLSSR